MIYNSFAGFRHVVKTLLQWRKKRVNKSWHEQQMGCLFSDNQIIDMWIQRLLAYPYKVIIRNIAVELSIYIWKTLFSLPT